MNYLNLIGVEKISGAQGPYDSKVQNPSVKYGRNAVANYYKYIGSYGQLTKDMLDFSNAKSMTDDEFTKKLEVANNAVDGKVNLKFDLQYLPEGSVDYKALNKMALLGASYEELGKKVSVTVQELTQKLQQAFGEKFSANFLDLNKDNNIDIGEYSTSILMADMLSQDQSALKAANVTGHITNDGENASLAYAADKNYDAASQDAKAIYEAFKLAEAQQEFVKEQNNLVQ